MTRPLVVCADDYAYSASICDAIVDLAERGRISAVSCMTTAPLWPAQAVRLRPYRDRIDIGLHLTLLEESPLTRMPRAAPEGRLPSLPALMAQSFAGRVPLAEYRAEIAAQIDAFTAAFGAPPAHLDGHRHTHVLPGLRTLVLEAAAALAPRPWVRNIAEGMGAVVARGVAVPKTLFLSALGAGLRSAAAAAGVTVNPTFSGVYSLAPDEPFDDLFARFLRAGQAGHVVMCHPGGDDDTPLGSTRAKEYAFLSGEAYPALLAEHGWHVARLARA